MNLKEDKILDLMIEAWELWCSYVPTPIAPAHPQLPLIASKIAQAKLIRTKSKARFLLHFDDLVNVSKRISEINLSAIEGEIPNNPKPNTTRSF
jgi:hypothetical protein